MVPGRGGSGGLVVGGRGGLVVLDPGGFLSQHVFGHNDNIGAP